MNMFIKLSEQIVDAVQCGTLDGPGRRQAPGAS